MSVRPLALCSLITLVGCHHGHVGTEPVQTQHGPLTLIATPSTVVADGKTAVTLTVIMSQDDIAAGTATGQPVTLTSTVSGDKFALASGVTSDHGVYTATVSSTVAGPRMLTAHVGNVQATRSVTFVATPAACDGTLLLSSVPSMAIGNSPLSLVRADFNHDGKLDLVAISSGNTGQDLASVLLGKGDGTFGPRTDYPIDLVPVKVAVGDFDGDGIVDIATANANTVQDHGQLSVLLGKGDGTFANALKGALNSADDHRNGTGGFLGIAGGDLNDDGKDDLVVTNYIGGQMLVLISKGDGTFGAPAPYDIDGQGVAVVIADFDGDGHRDIAVAGDSIDVLLNIGGGTLTPMGSYSVIEGPQSLALGDFNNDGKIDLTTGNADGTASVLLGNGDGTFGAELSYPVAMTFAVDGPVDLNGDGKLDLVVASDHSVSSLLGNGDGTFQSAVAVNTGKGPTALVNGDFDGDGKLDVVTANLDSGDVTLLRGRGDGSFVLPATYAAGSFAHTAITGDFDGDGQLDIVTPNSGGADVSVLLGKGDGSFQPRVLYHLGTQPEAVVIGDFDGDGHPDLATADAGSNSVSVLLGKGDGTFGVAVAYSVGMGPFGLATGDFNGDGVLDIATSDYLDGTVSVLLGNGDGTFQPSVHDLVGVGAESILSVDLDGDGHLDLAIANAVDSAVILLFGYGDGTFSTVSGDKSYSTGWSPLSLATADLNGDGHPDLVTANYNDGTATVLLNHGDGTFDSGASVVSGSGAAAVTIADLDGDGKFDLAVTNGGNPLYFGSGLPDTLAITGNDTVSVMHGNGDGTFRAATRYTVGGSPFGLTGGDFNGDGRTDVIVANNADSTLSVLLSTGCVP